MKVTCQQISGWITEYLNSCSSKKVLNRKLSDKLIHRLQCDRKDKETGENISQRWLKHIKENISAFDDCHDFQSILGKVKKYAKDFYGIGELTIYDTATYIGCPKEIYPNEVHLHAGTRIGARAIGITGRTATKAEFVKICKAFDQLTPIQIEDFLCIYKSCLQGDYNKYMKIKANCCSMPHTITPKGCK